MKSLEFLLFLTLVALASCASDDISQLCDDPLRGTDPDRMNFRILNMTGSTFENIVLKMADSTYRYDVLDHKFATSWVHIGGEEWAVTLAYIQDLSFEVDGVMYSAGSTGGFEIEAEDGLQIGRGYVVTIEALNATDNTVSGRIVEITGNIDCNDNPDGEPFGEVSPG